MKASADGGARPVEEGLGQAQTMTLVASALPMRKKGKAAAISTSLPMKRRGRRTHGRRAYAHRDGGQRTRGEIGPRRLMETRGDPPRPKPRADHTNAVSRSAGSAPGTEEGGRRGRGHGLGCRESGVALGEGARH